MNDGKVARLFQPTTRPKESMSIEILDTDKMYFRFCEACNCYEYDCHGLEGCIKLEDGYRNATQRHSDRKAEEEMGTYEYCGMTKTLKVLHRWVNRGAACGAGPLVATAEVNTSKRDDLCGRCFRRPL